MNGKSNDNDNGVKIVFNELNKSYDMKTIRPLKYV